MMKRFEANDTTFIILFRADSIARLENIIEIIRYLNRSVDTTIYVREADVQNNGILRAMCGDLIQYEFVEDCDPILHKTRHFNEMLKGVGTKFVAIWDTDLLVNVPAIVECIDQLRRGSAECALPYNGVCLDTSGIIRHYYLSSLDYGLLERNMPKMERLQLHILTGGAVIMNLESFLQIGGENEAYYGWGDDDFDRYIRFMNDEMKIYRTNNVSFHLSHPRGNNSGFNSTLHTLNSKGELYKTRYRR